MTTSKRGGLDLAADMRWARAQLLAGREVWCVRGRGHLVVMFITASPEDWKRFERWCINREDGVPVISGLDQLDAPLDNYTLTPVRLMDGEARFGIEGPWPGSPGHHAQGRALERGLRETERVGQIDRLSSGH